MSSTPSPDSGEASASTPAESPALDLKRLVEHLPGMAYRCRNDEHWTMEYVSAGVERLTGYTAGDLLENRTVSYEELIHPEDRSGVRRKVEEGLEDGFTLTYRIRHRDGTERIVWEQGRGRYTEDGELDALQGFITDITGRWELARQLAATERRYRMLVDQALVGVYVIQEGRFLYVNPRLAEIFGYTEEELLELDSINPLIHPEDRSLVAEQIARRLEGEESTIRYTFRGLHREGRTLHIEVHGGRMVEEEPRVMGVLVDISDQVRARELDHLTEKMDALRVLAGGVCHDFRNILSVIRTNAEVLRMDAGDDGLEELEEIVRAARRGSDLSDQLVSFVDRRKSHEGRVALNDAVEQALPMLRSLAGSSVRLESDLDPKLPPTELDPAGIDQVLMNLVINARDATEGRGRVEIRTRRRPGPLPGGDGEAHACLEVTDDGHGIPPEVQHRIFEPFFTLKGEGGSGLGLANVWAIVRGHDGVVEVESEVGEGTTFTVRFPSEPD